MTQSLANLHRHVSESRTRKHQNELDRHKKRTGIRQANFEVGDLVLVAARESHSGSNSTSSGRARDVSLSVILSLYLRLRTS
ncbi:unnamed protein product [Chondrus crispus]|uniref:Uncharacterized protein n=1 Tax=Chondrus crispus TaxID=2769 RepID=R7QF49_CHOCR|nr:unnamed protein product [Chondrus crispus]CDF36398.1 unnamed protein product [Chondrus crispus]|eukprot:XP_005716217.1 unnamed protein product [Chondrus crispus]